MKYISPSFSVASPGTEAYRTNWERIFGGASQQLQRDVLERALDLYKRYSVIEFEPWRFSGLGDAGAVLAALQALAATGHFISGYHLSCANGHTISRSFEFPTSGATCAVCGVTVNLEDSLSFSLKPIFILRRDAGTHEW